MIQDGVGYGGVRIGMTSDELSRAWGPTVVARSTGQAYNVRTFRLDTGETILAMLKGDKVESLQFIDSRRPGETPLRTSQGVEMGDLVDRVRTVYGDPEQDNEVFFYYFSEGIAFGRDCPRKNAHRSDGGMVRPSAFAVLRLMTNSDFVGCSIGRSPGWAPFRILSTYRAARRRRAEGLTP